MLILKYIMIFLIATVVVVADAIPQPYSKAMVANSQKYVEYAFLANDVYDENTDNVNNNVTKTIFDSTWEVFWYESHKNGFQGAVYRRYGKWVVAIGGTTASPSNVSKLQKYRDSAIDILTDIRLVSNLVPTSQAESVLKFIKDIQAEGIKIDTIVGHSLGGGLAAYAGLYYNINTITFNTSPIPFTKESVGKFLSKHAITLPYGSLKKDKKFAISYTHSDKIINIMSNNDPLTHEVNLPLIAWDNKEFNPTNFTTPLNRAKLIMLIPIQMKLNYIMTGKDIELDIDTGHSIAKMLEKMKDAKRIDEYNKLDAIYTYYTNKLKKLEKSEYVGYVYPISYYQDKASLNYILVITRKIYARIKKINIQGSSDNFDDYFSFSKFLTTIGLKDTDLAKRISVSTKGNISYKEYMLIAEAMYRKLFGGSPFFSSLRKKNKKEVAFYDRNYAKYASKDMNMIYGHIFLLHHSLGTPKKYLKNDSQGISNAFVINFLDRFLDVLVMYKSKIK